MVPQRTKKRIARLICGSVPYVAALTYWSNDATISFLLFLTAFAILGWDIIYAAIRNIAHGHLLDENFLMSVATIGALCIGQYAEGVAVMLFFQVGEMFQNYALDRSRRSIASLMDIRPDYANVKRGDIIEKVDPYDVKVGDIIVIRAGEKIPLDAEVVDGNAMIDASALTGESMPREVCAGDALLSGCIDINGLITARVTKEFGESTVSKILELVENASDNKSRAENFITRFARIYTPVVIFMAAIIAVVPPMVLPGATFDDWVARALTFLVISCPCALVLSIPLGFFGGIGAASSNGILVKGSNYLEALARTEVVVFDKTGTLTKGTFKVHEIVPMNVEKDEILRVAAYAEYHSNHPISASLRKAYGKTIECSLITATKEMPGRGIAAAIDGRQVLVGNAKLMNEGNIMFEEQTDAPGTIVYVAVDAEYWGHILIADEPREDAARAISNLKAAGIRRTVMLTGDSKGIGEDMAKRLGIDEVYADLLPSDKVTKFEELVKGRTEKGTIAFVGDGINDAPVLARADIGIAMGGVGSDAAIEAADIVIMTDEPSKIATAMKISQFTLRIVMENIIFILAVKSVFLVLGAFGIATLWEAVFADVGVSIIAILNSIRVLGLRKMKVEGVKTGTEVGASSSAYRPEAGPL
jgi:Zn2+/Cd2+-exporting ATPase